MKLAHDNVLKIHQLGRTEDFKLDQITGYTIILLLIHVSYFILRCVVMDLCDYSLGQVFETSSSTDQLNVLYEIACGVPVAYIHSENVIHRDIKPKNNLISFDGRVKVADCGCAKPTTKRGSCSWNIDHAYTLIYLSPKFGHLNKSNKFGNKEIGNQKLVDACDKALSTWVGTGKEETFTAGTSNLHDQKKYSPNDQVLCRIDMQKEDTPQMKEGSQRQTVNYQMQINDVTRGKNSASTSVAEVHVEVGVVLTKAELAKAFELSRKTHRAVWLWGKKPPQQQPGSTNKPVNQPQTKNKPTNKPNKKSK